MHIRSILLLLALSANAAHATDTSSPKEIEKIVSRIPVTDKDFGYKNIGERLPKFGMTVDRAKVEKVSKGDAEPPQYLAGDEIITLYLSRPNEVATSICPITGGMTIFVLRGKKVIPQSRTGHWLMTNRCDFKG